MGLFQAFDISASWNDSRTLSYGHDRTEYCKYKYNEDGRRYTISEKDRYICRKDRNTFSQYYETARARAVGNGVKVTSVKRMMRQRCVWFMIRLIRMQTKWICYMPECEYGN